LRQARQVLQQLTPPDTAWHLLVNVSFRPNAADDENDVLQKIASASFYDTRCTSPLEHCDSEHWNLDRCGLLPWLNKL